MSALTLLQANVRRIMADRGMTQADVAKAGGISQASVSNACRATRGQQLDTIVGLAKGLGVSVSDLFSPSDTAENGRLLELFAPLPPESKSQVLRVAEMESRFQETSAKE